MNKLEESMELIHGLNEIYKHFGYQAQIGKLAEECKEFIADFDTDFSDLEAVDVFVVAAQIILNNPAMFEHAKYKINRTLERIEDGFYDRKETSLPAQEPI